MFHSNWAYFLQPYARQGLRSRSTPSLATIIAQSFQKQSHCSEPQIYKCCTYGHVNANIDVCFFLNMGQFSSFSQHNDKYSIKFHYIKTDGVLGNRTRDHKMKGAHKSTELCPPPTLTYVNKYYCPSSINQLQCRQVTKVILCSHYSIALFKKKVNMLTYRPTQPILVHIINLPKFNTYFL